MATTGGVAAMDVGSGDEAEEERIEQTLSYRILARDSKALKYHTGLRPEAQAWLMAALRDAVRFSRDVAVLVVRTSGVVFGRRLCGILWLMESFSHRTTKLWGGLRGIGAIPTLAFESSTRTIAFCSSCSECGVACPEDLLLSVGGRGARLLRRDAEAFQLGRGAATPAPVFC